MSTVANIFLIVFIFIIEINMCMSFNVFSYFFHACYIFRYAKPSAGCILVASAVEICSGASVCRSSFAGPYGYPDFPVIFGYTSDRTLGESFMQITAETYGMDNVRLCQVSGIIGIHPNENTATIWMKTEDLLTMIRRHGNEAQVVEL